METLKFLEEFEQWSEVTKGLYRFVIAANVCYEIHILFHSKDTDLLTAKASLFIVGDWGGADDYFERECLLAEEPVYQCLREAVKDYKENME